MSNYVSPGISRDRINSDSLCHNLHDSPLFHIYTTHDLWVPKTVKITIKISIKK